METSTSVDLSKEGAILSPEQVQERFSSLLLAEKREHFYALAMNAKGIVEGEFLVAIGSLTSVHVTPREAFRPLVIAAAAQAIFVHNHPSGDPTPSRQDIALTECLFQAGALLGIRVVDHVIVARDGFVSMAARMAARGAAGHGAGKRSAGAGGRSLHGWTTDQ